MPFLNNGIYIHTDEIPFEKETNYYVEFQIRSALFSFEKLYNKDDIGFDSKYQFYHYYTDHLLYSLGQIGSRFIITKNDNKIIKERKTANCQNYEFSNDKYPILSDKSCRNTIEHIDEYDYCIISKNKGVGGFNLIDFETLPELAETLRKRRNTHIYTLDLVNGELLITHHKDEITICLKELKQELLNLYNRTKYIKEFLQNI